MKPSLTLACAVALVVVASSAQAPAKGLQMYVVDVEGGNATLFVAPSGESVFIDTGNPGARDADRIMAAVKDAGVTAIDHLITTHWHGDHFGGMSELATRIPIRHFIDHGPTVQPQSLSTDFLQNAYPGLYGKARHTVVQPGDRIPVAGLDWRIVSTVPGLFIANGVDEQPAGMPIEAIAPPPGAAASPPPAHNGPAYWIKVSAREDGTFTVTNQRNGFSKTYAVEGRPGSAVARPSP